MRSYNKARELCCVHQDVAQGKEDAAKFVIHAARKTHVLPGGKRSH